MKNPTKETQSGLEELFSKHQLMPVLRDEFKELAVQFETVDTDLATEALAQISLHRQCDVPTLVGILSPKFGEPQEVADALLVMCEEDLLDYNESKQRFMVVYDISPDVQAMLDRYQYPLPMITPPNQVTKNSETGYETIFGSVVLNGTKFFKGKDLCLDHLNRANSVSLSLDLETITSAEGAYIRPVRNPGEDFLDFRKRQKQSDTFYATSVEVMETINGLSDELFMTHKYDRRGRCYSSGYHVNPQGTDYNKAVLCLSKKEVING